MLRASYSYLKRTSQKVELGQFFMHD